VFTTAAARTSRERTCLPWKFEDFRVLSWSGVEWGAREASKKKAVSHSEP
jgi:hypothetical protein